MSFPGGFDVIITYEDRVYDAIVNGMNIFIIEWK